MTEITRRDFVGGAAAVAGAALVASPALADEAPAGFAIPRDFTAEDIANSSVELEPITEFAAEETYDIVVVGAGCAGVPAALTAIEEGASVGVLQREEDAQANGMGCSAVIKGESTPAGIQRWKNDWATLNDFRVNMKLFDYWIDHSEETQSWIVQKTYEAGLEPASFKTSATVVYEDGEIVALAEDNQASNTLTMQALAALAESKGAVFHYSTPAVQLVIEDGAVRGVIGKDAEGNYIKMNANVAVILACGDYMNNETMLERFNGDMRVFWRKQFNRTGDGHILAGTAGARIAPTGHAKMVHGMIGAFMTTPLLVLDPQGKRFMNEDCVMTKWNAQLVNHFPLGGDTPEIFRFFDGAVEEKYTDLKTSLERVNAAYEKDGVASVSSRATYYRADTLEELLEQAGLPVEDAMASIERYNEICASGVDEDFGVRPGILKPLDTPPFYCVKDHPGLSAIAGGMLVDEHYQFLDGEGNPIPGLFGAGVNADNLCGGTNWNMPGGSSNSRCFNAGRYAVIYALTGGLEPSNPCTFEQVAQHFADAEGTYFWNNGKARKSIELW